jgi:predicted PurR-regulated permease PerM
MSEIIDTKYIASNILSLGKIVTSVSVNFIKDVAMILIFYALVLVYIKPISTYMESIIPFENKKIQYFTNNITSNMSITFLAVIITAVLEGLLFSILVSYFNYDGWLFGVLFAFASLIPIVGGALMWLPLSLYEYFNGSLQNALIISLYTIIVISIITDTFIKTYIIKVVKKNIGHSNFAINEVILLFSIIAGLSQFGFWGVLIGPIINIVLLSLLDFYQKNFKIH